jgi:hypothetical protein
MDPRVLQITPNFLSVSLVTLSAACRLAIAITKMKYSLLIGASLLSSILAQSSDTNNAVGTPTAIAPTYIESTVPTGTPIPGNYTGSLRPQIHFSPPQKFMNDPNGMFVDSNGTWHLYYQCEFVPVEANLI